MGMLGYNRDEAIAKFGVCYVVRTREGEMTPLKAYFDAIVETLGKPEQVELKKEERATYTLSEAFCIAVDKFNLAVADGPQREIPVRVLSYPIQEKDIPAAVLANARE